MKRKFKLIILLFLISLFSCKQEKFNMFYTDYFQIEINNQGFITGLIDKTSNKDYMPDGKASPVLAVVDDGQLKMPASITKDHGNKYKITYEQSKLVVGLSIEENPTHITFRINDVSGDEDLEAVIWGPYSNVIKDTIGENIGVVRNSDFAIGIQSLNPKTTAGKLNNIIGKTSYLGSAAEETEYGSILQAFAINRTRDLSNSNWVGWTEEENWCLGWPFHKLNEAEGSVTGSAISLFGCHPTNALKTIGEIEVAEGLPHPEIDGVWIKDLKDSGRAYAISPFTENNVDTMIDYTKMAGLRALYHEGPFKSWGSFILDKKMFPKGRKGLKSCVEKAEKEGLYTGVHTLTMMIDKNDPLVCPVPDRRLRTLGRTNLVKDISATTTDIEIADIDMLTLERSYVNAVRIMDELIQYGSYSEEKPYILYDCKRGAWGTKASAHKSNEDVAKLADNTYGTFYPNWDMQKDVIKNMTNFLNECGITQMDFDGHEGCVRTGHGDYAMDLFAQEWYDQLDHIVINGSSRLKHYYWHINHYINWGEPWYGGFRESESDRRFSLQPFLERNYMRNMLGWFLIKSSTIPTDVEWMMARAAGYNAGFALVLRLSELRDNPYTEELLSLIKTWEEARLAGAFSKELREKLKDDNNEFHLEKIDDNTLILHTYSSNSFEHVKKVLQPGEPTDSQWDFRNENEAQLLQFRITVKGEEGKIVKPVLEFNRSFEFKLPKELKAGYSLACNGSNKLRVYDQKGNFVDFYDMGVKPPVVRKGKHYLRFKCHFEGNDDLKVNVVVKQKGGKVRIDM